MTGKTTVRYRPDESPYGGDRVWECRCWRLECVNDRNAWTWHLSWWQAMGRAYAHLRDSHRLKVGASHVR